MRKTYLVTGAAGFIGSAVARRLVADGHQVVTVDNLRTGIRAAIPPQVIFVEGDCQDPQVIARLEGYAFDAILHIAGQSSGEISFDDPVYDLQTNTQSTLLLLLLARKTGCRQFIYASSMSVYGEQPDAPISEEAVTTPKSFYAVGKLASEHYLRIYQQYGIASTALRLFNVYGPGQNMDNLRQGMASIYLAMALKDRHIHVKGSPERFRDFVYIQDVVEAFLTALRAGHAGARIYNVGTGVRTTVKQVVTAIQGALPFPVTMEYAGSTPGDQFGIYADVSRIKGELGFEARVNFSSGIGTMAAWALDLEAKRPHA